MRRTGREISQRPADGAFADAKPQRSLREAVFLNHGDERGQQPMIRCFLNGTRCCRFMSCITNGNAAMIAAITMATRREFIQMSIAASALPFARVARAGTNGGEEPRSETSDRAWSLYRFVVDDRFPESAAAGRAAARQGVTVHVMNGGDITRFWFHDLSLRWQREPVAIAGLTAHGPLFVLERFAWDHGMRVVVRDELPGSAQRSRDGEPLFSWVIARVPPQV
jgi:hypothetical protein